MANVDKSWNLKLVRAREALDLLRQAQGDKDEIDWGDVWIAHPDTGYTRNPVFGWNGDESGMLLTDRGLNFKEAGDDPHDPLTYSGFPGHGTRIASVLCGNLPGNFVGVAPGVPTVPYRVTNSVILSKKERRRNIANAIRHAIDFNCCDIITISLGINTLSFFGGRPLGKAVDYAYENGVIVVAAGGQVIDRVTYPGKFARTIGVGGVSPNREVWFRYHEDWLDNIDVWAPADEIWRANTVIEGGAEKYDYDFGDGTSYATVHVSGAAAMWLVYRDDDINAKYDQPWQRVEAFRKLLKATHQAVEGGFQPAEGTGILDIKAVLEADLPDLTDDDFVAQKAEVQIF